LCHAKITPAALQRGENRARCVEGSEAAGANPKFRLSKFAHWLAGGPVPVV
jgi:hypothetical protein